MRGHVHKTSAKFSGFSTPPPPSSTFYVLFVCKIGQFFDPPPPLTADVLCTSSLMMNIISSQSLCLTHAGTFAISIWCNLVPRAPKIRIRFQIRIWTLPATVVPLSSALQSERPVECQVADSQSDGLSDRDLNGVIVGCPSVERRNARQKICERRCRRQHLK